MYQIEEWKDIKGYEGIYQVSNFGNVKNISKKKGVLWENPKALLFHTRKQDKKVKILFEDKLFVTEQQFQMMANMLFQHFRIFCIVFAPESI